MDACMVMVSFSQSARSNEVSFHMHARSPSVVALLPQLTVDPIAASQQPSSAFPIVAPVVASPFPQRFK